MKGFEDRLGKGPISLISIVIAFFVMLYSSQYDWLWRWMTEGFGIWLGIAVVILLLIILLAMLGIKDLTELNWKKAVIVIIVIYVLAVGLLGGTNLGVYGLGYLLSGSDLWTLVIFVIILAVAMYLMTREGGKSGGNSGEAAKAS
jgi:hypothetical protein